MPYLQKLQQLQQLQPVSTTLPTFCKIFCKPGDVCQTISNQTTANMALGMNNLYVCRAVCGCLQVLLIIGQQYAGNIHWRFQNWFPGKLATHALIYLHVAALGA